MHAYTHAYAHVSTHMPIPTFTQMFIHMSQTHAYTHAYTHVYAHTYTHAYTHVYAQVYCPPGSKVTHQPSTKNDAMNDVSQYHIYNAASLSFNGIDNKKATLNRESTEDFSSTSSRI